MNTKFIFCLLLSVGFVLSLSGMNKGVGALQVGTGAAAMVPNGILVTKLLVGGAALTAPATVLFGGAALAGLGVLAGGIEKLLKSDEIKIQDGEVTIQFKDPADGKLVSMRYSGFEATRFLEKKGFIISWRDNYLHQNLSSEKQTTINNVLPNLQQHFGRPTLYGVIVEINNPELRAEHALKIQNPVGVDEVANKLAERRDLFDAFRYLAVHSWGTPSHKDNPALFTNTLSQFIAKLMQVTAAAHAFPLEELVRNERAAKVAAQATLAGQQATAEQNIATLARLSPNQNNFLLTLRQRFGIAVGSNGETVELQQPLRGYLEQVVNNPTNQQLQIERNNLNAVELNNLFEWLRLKALVPGNDFKASAIEVLANLSLARLNGYALPQIEERNRLRAEKGQVDAQLAQAQQRAQRIQEESTVQKFQIYAEAAQAEEQHNRTLAQTQTFLEEADRRAIEREGENEAILDSYRDRLLRLNERKDRTIAHAVAQALEVAAQGADLEEENNELRQRALRGQQDATTQKFQLYQQAAQLEAALQTANEKIETKDANTIQVALEAAQMEEENGALRQQLQALQQQLAESQRTIRKQSKNNRKTINKLHVLERAQQKKAQQK